MLFFCLLCCVLDFAHNGMWYLLSFVNISVQITVAVNILCFILFSHIVFCYVPHNSYFLNVFLFTHVYCCEYCTFHPFVTSGKNHHHRHHHLFLNCYSLTHFSRYKKVGDKKKRKQVSLLYFWHGRSCLYVLAWNCVLVLFIIVLLTLVFIVCV